MKNIYSFKKFLKFGFLMILLSSLLGVVSSCKKNDDEDITTHNVQFKVEATSGVVLKAAVYQVGTVQTSNYAITGTSWSSDNISVASSQASVNLASTATGLNAASTLTVKIYIDGVLTATNTATGIDLKAITSYSFYKQY